MVSNALNDTFYPSRFDYRSLIDEVHKKINSLLLEAEEGEGEAGAEQPGGQVQEQTQVQEREVEQKEEEEEEDVGGLVDTDEEEDRKDEVLHWIEQYDPESGYNFYYNDLTHETQWEPPADSAYVPVSLDAMGYEMVEENTAGEENADWEWDEEGGKWVYKGETIEDDALDDQQQEQKEEGGKPNIVKLKTAKNLEEVSSSESGRINQ